MSVTLPPVVATLVADSKEFNAALDESMGKMDEFAGTADAAGTRFGSFLGKASTAVIAAGVAIGAYGIDKALKFQSALDQVQNTTNATTKTIDKIKKSAIDLSNTTVSSATDIVSAYQLAEAAGYKWSKAQGTVTAAAKLGQITQQSVVTTTQALIAAQNLGLTKNMSAAKVAAILTVALKGNESGLSGVIGVLQSKVGAAFAGYHQSLGEAVAISNEFSKANFTNTRQIASFVSKIGTMQGPMETVSTTNGKLSVSTASWVNSLTEVGLNATKTRDAFAGPNGLVNGLNYLKQAADGSLPKLREEVEAIWGSAGTPAAMALITNLGTLTKTITATKSATAGGFNKAFDISQGQIDNQMKEIKNQAENILQGVGMFLLPDVKDLANWVEDASKYFKSHPLVSKIASDAAIGLFAAAVAYKVASALSKVVSGVSNLFGKGAQAEQTGVAKSSLTYLQQIASNTAKMAGEEGVADEELAAGGAGIGSKASKGAGFLGIADLLGPLAIGYEGLKDIGNAVDFLKNSKSTYDPEKGGLFEKIANWIGGGSSVTLSPASLNALNASLRRTDTPTADVLPGFNHHKKTTHKKTTVKVRVTR